MSYFGEESFTVSCLVYKVYKVYRYLLCNDD